jgi:peptide-methionine (S)-S-oxide reductase
MQHSLIAKATMSARSIAPLYSLPGQKADTEAFIKELEASASEGDPIVTTIEEGAVFYPAEDYHKNYYANNKNQGYCQVIIAPKLQKVQEKFAELLQQKV